ncbi:GHH signature containing HNH/Endo VII superfamily nuclease toxin 2 [Rhizobium mongolense subsp. loessense]|uniref:GHH signature containing HNH/Endo VII superfamily nuclease toxin 2 n=1 Tax=Rhizobium mongolense subsp. loessense TaxID=158890 RepID=A0A1G4TN70_9HYPH|nr:PAAR-like domain-containing protein [Rhizobium mongolense]SCW82772.1 GHH signature containing HNH/Endo VII superfamily nuclease toxin 2 [Rhizobium mongolense subsp. loessense]
MGDVYANGLEISGKAVNARTIAVFPDTCFTPPENPATPPGVPVPYPSFGFASETEKGTGTVKIGGQTVNIKNKSDLSRTSGTEAGCAAKKGIITSKNMGKEYFHSWSNDVKFDGEPVIRMSDLATNNHASPQSNTVTWPHVAKLKSGRFNCEQVLNDLKIHLHKHEDNPCGSMSHNGQQLQSEHMCMNAFFQNNRAQDTSIKGFEKYSCKGAPCICMQGPGHANPNSTHGKKTMAQFALVADLKESDTQPTLGKVIDSEMESIKANHENLQPRPGDRQHNAKVKAALDCLKQVVENYFEWVTGKNKKDMRETECRMPQPSTDFPTPPSGVRLPGTVTTFR